MGLVFFLFFFFTNHHTPLTWHLIHLSIVNRKIFIGILNLFPTAHLGQVHKDHTTYRTAPVKEDLHVMSLFLSFGDEVANTE